MPGRSHRQPYAASQYIGQGLQYASKEDQPLLQSAGYLPGDRGKAEQDRSAISIQHLFQISGVAWVVFSIVTLLFGLSYHDSSVEIWTLVSLGSFVLIMVAGQSWLQWNQAQMARVSFVVAAWLLFSIAMGALVGLYANDCCIQEYWTAHQLEARTNVLPSGPAAAYSNSGMINFATEARVDASKAVGFRDNSVYCVAPILSEASHSTVQFWAIGTDCCRARGSFTCDDAWNPKARSGLVVHKTTSSLPMMAQDAHAQYMRAVNLAEATYAIASAEEPVFVRWVADPEQVTSNMWRTGFGVLLAAIIISSLLCGLQAFAINMVLRK